MNTLIADSGATKTDWALVRDGKPVFIRTSGLHPAYLDKNDPSGTINRALFGDFQPDRICFYGAGCYSDESAIPVRAVLKTLFGEVYTEVHDDLTAVAHAFLERREGIAAVLGTGSASGHFRDGRLQQQVPPLGYVMGDEGSAADIGKRLLRACLRGNVSEETTLYVESRIGQLEYHSVMDDLYQAVRPSYFLAQVTERVLQGEVPAEIAGIVRESIEAFAESHLAAYEQLHRLPLVLTGGIALSRSSDLDVVMQSREIRNYTVKSGLISALAASLVSTERSRS